MNENDAMQPSQQGDGSGFEQQTAMQGAGKQADAVPQTVQQPVVQQAHKAQPTQQMQQSQQDRQTQRAGSTQQAQQAQPAQQVHQAQQAQQTQPAQQAQPSQQAQPAQQVRYTQQPVAAPPAKQSTSGLAIAGLVLGIVAAVTSFLPIVNNMSFFMAIVGLVLAIAGFVSTRKGKRSGKGIAIAGIVLGIVSIAIVLATQALYSATLDAVSAELKSGSTPISGSAAKAGSNAGAADAGTDYHALAVGTPVELKNGLKVTVNAIEGGLQNYDGSEAVRVNVSYVNDGSKNESFNVFDWKAEDAEGAQRSQAYFANADAELSSGQLSAGGSVSGNIYFDAPVVKVHYYGNVFDNASTAAWVA